MLPYIWGMENTINTDQTKATAQGALKFTSWTAEQRAVIERIAADGYIDMTAAEMTAFDGIERTGDATYRVVLRNRIKANYRIAKKDYYLLPWEEAAEQPPRIVTFTIARRVVEGFVEAGERTTFNVKNDDRADVHELIADVAPECIYSYASCGNYTTFQLIK